MNNKDSWCENRVAHLSLEDDVLVLPVLDDADRLQRADDVVRVGGHLLTDVWKQRKNRLDYPRSFFKMVELI